MAEEMGDQTFDICLSPLSVLAVLTPGCIPLQMYPFLDHLSASPHASYIREGPPYPFCQAL